MPVACLKPGSWRQSELRESRWESRRGVRDLLCEKTDPVCWARTAGSNEEGIENMFSYSEGSTLRQVPITYPTSSSVPIRTNQFSTSYLAPVEG